MASQGFSVDTTKLLEVATSVHQLRNDLAGVGSVAGSLSQYETKAAASILTNALASFWDGTDVFAKAYSTEHNGIVLTMKSMLSQLDALEKACRTTAAQYSTHEGETKTTVNRSDPRTW
ncbi:hypothetical protein [Jatrophihabitans endophyticus]|uniref:hypothetical protein n=1 Tax=Jatrophihabitans endophyticus TaxID=1206085 RepID=UPI0019FF44D9|nr:hypothetical protein [Jatrophihabitans endophyticus]MBE7186693.1 hypothetical protein [Jatrophihabitans endophyticus]